MHKVRGVLVAALLLVTLPASADFAAGVAAYERGAALKRHCEAKLQEAQGRVERIVLGNGGPAGLPAGLEDAGLD